jgi:cysteine-rich repeat protein
MRIATAVTFTLFAAACGGDPDPIVIDPDGPSAICGNSIVETAAGEQCDDGNTADGDGCSSTCQMEVALCSVLPDLTSLGLGSAQMRTPNDWFDTPATGPNMGRKYLVIVARLPPDLSTPGSTGEDALVIELGAVGGAFIINTAKNFDTSVGAAAGTAPYDARASIIGDFVIAGGQLNFEKFYGARSGAITITEIGENNGNAIDGSVNATNFAEVDDQGNVVAAGCTTSMDGLTFALTQMAMPKPGAIPTAGEFGAAFTRDELELLWKASRERRAKMQANQQ